MPYITDRKGDDYLLGIHRAKVVGRDDNQEISNTPHRGRIQIEIPYLRDDENTGKPYQWWCDYCGPSHQFFSVPAVGTEVYVMFNGGNPEQPIWVGAVNTTAAVKDPPTRFRRDTPDVSGYESLNGGAKGHVWEFNDIQGERRIYFEDINENYIEFDTELDDLNVFFQHDENREIQNDRFTTIGNDDQLDIGNDNRITIGNDQTRDITNNQTLTVGADQTETITGNRTATVETDDALTVQGNKTQDITGTWDDTIQDSYSMTGQSTGDWDFQDNISFTTLADLVHDVTGNWDATVVGDWSSQVTGQLDFQITDNVTIESQADIEIKNTLFEVTMSTATMTLGSATSNIQITPAGIVITVGGTTQTWDASGSTFVGSAYTLAGIDHITHTHYTFGVPPQETSPPI